MTTILTSSNLNLKRASEFLRAQEAEPPSFAIRLPFLERLQEVFPFRGTLIEIIGAPSSGRFAVALSALAAATGAGAPAALVDLGDHLDPQGAERAGVDLARLLWLRPRRLKEAASGAEMILAAGFPLVVLDLTERAASRLPDVTWVRLSRAAKAQKGILLLLSPAGSLPISGWTADALLIADQARPIWLGTGSAPKLLAGLSIRLTLRLRRGRRTEISEKFILPIDRTFGEGAPGIEKPEIKKGKGALQRAPASHI
ncbi:MAG TPA: hypothetical protein VFA47_01605 [Candidatus Manganitrophaceae bacterium]|nr:hypothetical protein [Candidatus Manganitrophaceae bacterium]